MAVTRPITHRVALPLTRRPVSPGVGMTAPLKSLIDSLFGNGEQGAMYIPKPQALGQQVLYQDAAGTIPVVADGDPVGLVLDLSQGLVRGPELFTGQVPTVQNSSGSDAVYDPATRTLTSNLTGGPGAFPRTQFDLGLEPGKVYEIDLTFSGDVDSVTSVRSGYDASSALPIVEPGRAQGVLTAVDHRLIVFSSSVLPFSVTFDSLSVRELPGNHAKQTTSAARPIYRTDGTLHWLEFDGVDDSLAVPDYVIGRNSYPDGNMLSAAIEYTGAESSFNVLGSIEGTDRRYYIATGPGQLGNQMQFGMGSVFEVTGYEFTKGRAIVAGMGWESGEIVGREDGEEVVRGESSWGSEGGTLYLGTVPGNRANRHFNGRFYGVIIRDEYDSTSGDGLRNTEQYLANLAGIAL